MIEDFDFDEDVIIVNGFDDCIIGKDFQKGRAVYSIEKIIEKQMIKNNWTLEESIENFDHNIGSAYVGEYTPVFVWQGDGYQGSAWELARKKEQSA